MKTLSCDEDDDDDDDDDYAAAAAAAADDDDDDDDDYDVEIGGNINENNSFDDDVDVGGKSRNHCREIDGELGGNIKGINVVIIMWNLVETSRE